MRATIEAVLPFWLDRPDEEAMKIAQAASQAGLTGLWIGEMASFDAFALATAIGTCAPGLRITVGPLPISVRTPVAIALGASSVASLTGCEIDVALGASSPAIVTGWHDREWQHGVARMRETIECLRPILRGERAEYDGRYIRSHGFRLRNPLPHSRIGIGTFGPAMARLAGELADEAVLNLSTPQRVAEMRRRIDDYAIAADRRPPYLTVWVPVALRPGDASLRQVANQLAIYLAPPGYGEMFIDLGFAGLVERARSGVRRAELASAIPLELAEQLCAFGAPDQIASRLHAYLDAGADTVAVVPVTAEDPAGRAVLECAKDAAAHRLVDRRSSGRR
ncbi:putative F420-dependent oxidoreductase, Rv3093c family [Mycobacterium sp. JS623]|uniref:LLM class F420-dependent oxidoreductase n=1 Tax=Mycobacterium sp. JS623 TaxID=212767 RepID=UPI0002A57A26|nr:LLM class F420-dependent oxidoreductase [Mycobacterium sp. JS623]AGB24216.1 putative F420-dependent oxidoreductase, Rv3093c family [Mycobacterium sp. JS623]